ncbi:hypothetical protein [Rhizobium ruizarguesonis]|uniref:hypothetical protein n=1 Tax=Rhizobium ruizarguesonis TaxID=2081791 RepID=UPI001032251F|nr:hypothetical protein [Rhizobium ruizarguesonis]TBA48916.1 hypothetical protein ELH63_15330 [Rhizobium ruizarguesonis]TBB02858.1 hypothetical protein ELH52_15265 [Rhizobium ruizarguesonis]
MYNLLMIYSGWEGARDSMPLSRVFEYTAEDIVERYRSDAGIRFDDLIRLPCLFMAEGTGPEIARVGRIFEYRVSGNEVVIEYGFDQTVPSLLNSTIFAHKRDFDMPHDFEFSRGHWAVKDVDLFKVLLGVTRSHRQRPRVFNIAEHESIDASLISIMMPFDPVLLPVFETLRAMATGMRLRLRRADDMWDNEAVIQDVVSLIDRSRVVIADCTGRNSNVFYEVGIAHTLGREVILIAQSANDVPFDLRHLRIVEYQNNQEGLVALRDILENRIADLLGR